MKKILVCMMLSLLITTAEAQTGNAKNKAAAKTTASKTKKQSGQTTTVLTSTSTNKAYAASSIARLQISDSTTNAMNQKAAGVAIGVSNSSITGMPKGTYGFANGKLWLRNTTATTSGASYGSGAVGTGTSILGAGTSESSIGVNGKSPDAGVWLWGDRRPTYTVPLADSVRRQ